MLNRKAVGALGVDLKFKPDRDYDRTQKFLGVVASMISQAVKVQRLIDNERKKLLDENTHLRQELRERYDFSNLLGTSGPMRQICEQVAQVARTMTTALIRGESGTGKELIAHAIHYNSLRANKPFVKVSCAALPESLIESELFGYEKGAFTGAQQRKKGRFELAEGGTLFLDEIGDINLATQVKLLRVLQEREYERLGGTETLKSNVRLVTATNKDLEKAIQDGTFREDLYYRLNVFTIFVPPLRERKTDLLLLADHFLESVLADAQQEHQAHLDAGDRHADELSLAGQRARAREHARARRARLRRPRHPRAPSAADAADRRGVGHGHARLAARCGRRLRKGSDLGRAEDHPRQSRQGRAPAEHDRAHHQLSGEEVLDRLPAVQELTVQALGFRLVGLTQSLESTVQSLPVQKALVVLPRDQLERNPHEAVDLLAARQLHRGIDRAARLSARILKHRHRQRALRQLGERVRRRVYASDEDLSRRDACLAESP